MLKAFLKDGAIYAIPTFLSRGISFILIPFYTRVLTPADYGSLDLLAAFTTLVKLTVALEVSQGIARYFAGEKDPVQKITYFSSALWFACICYGLFAVFALLWSGPLSTLVMGRGELTTEFRVGTIGIVTNGVLYLIHSQFRWELQSKTYALISIIVLLVTSGLSFTFTYLLDHGLVGLIYGQAIGNFTGITIGLFLLRNRLHFHIDMSSLKKMLKFSLPLVPSGIAVFLSTYIDRLMIDHFLSVDEVGVYGIGFRLATVIGLVLAGFQGAVTPLIYANHERSDTPYEFARIFRFFISFTLIAFAVLSLFAKEILVLITTASFYKADQVIIYLVPAILLAQMYIFAPGLAIKKKTKYILWINVGGAGLNVLLNWLLIPYFGISGAALATMLNYLVVFSVYMMISQRLYPVPHKWIEVIGAIGLVAILVLSFQTITMDSYWRIISQVIGLILVPIIIFCTRLIQLNELKEIFILLKIKKTS